MIYLASPYSHDDPAIRAWRYRTVCNATAALMRKGEMVFSPIAHSHGIALYGVPGNWEYWMNFDRWFIERCDELRILMLDGWKESKGVRAERNIAAELGKLINWITLKECLQCDT